MEVSAKILVTGARGMLGSAVVDLLDAQGFKNVLKPSRSELDLLKEEGVSHYMRLHRPTHIFHLASLVFGLKGNIQNQLRSLKENTTIYSSLLSACEENPPQKIFFAGTVASYPYPFPSLPLKEIDFFSGLPHGGEFGYAMAKRHAYAYLELLNKLKGVKFVYGVFTNLYGEHDTYDIENGHVVPSLICKAVTALQNNKPTFEVWGNPDATRDFLYIKDAAQAALNCMIGGDGIVNLASGTSVSMHDLAFEISNCLNNDVRPVWNPSAPVGILSRSISTEKLAATGFIPEYPFKQAVENALLWYQRNVASL